MGNANDLNFLISSHDNYVESILERALLTGMNPSNTTLKPASKAFKA